MIQTGKYDRKAMRARLALENWIDDELTELYGDQPYTEIDVGEVCLSSLSLSLSLSLSSHLTHTHIHTHNVYTPMRPD